MSGVKTEKENEWCENCTFAKSDGFAADKVEPQSYNLSTLGTVMMKFDTFLQIQASKNAKCLYGFVNRYLTEV